MRQILQIMPVVRWVQLFIQFAMVLIVIMMADLRAQSVYQVPETDHDIKMSFAPLVRQTSPAVVNVYAERMVEQRSPFAGDPFFERFFERQLPHRIERQSSLGSGVVIDSSGIVVTNHHVIQGADDIKVAFLDGREYSSRILLKDQSVDLAILEIIGGDDFPTLTFGNSDTLEVGDIVLAIGNPFGVGQTVTSGIISALARNQVGNSDFGFFIQTDAAINPGNSGGALIDVNGKLIGINTAIFSRSGGSNGIGFAIPSRMVQAVKIVALNGHDKFVKPFIGASFETVTSDIARALGLDSARGALITSLIPQSPAEQAGLKPGDLVFSFNEHLIEHPDALNYRLAITAIGSTIKLGVYSKGQKKVIPVTLTSPPKDGIFNTIILEGNHPFSGAKIAKLTPFSASELKLPIDYEGMVILTVERGSLSDRYGFMPGDIITSVSGIKLKTFSQLKEILSAGAEFWRLEMIRNNRIISLDIAIK